MGLTMGEAQVIIQNLKGGEMTLWPCIPHGDEEDKKVIHATGYRYHNNAPSIGPWSTPIAIRIFMRYILSNSTY